MSVTAVADKRSRAPSALVLALALALALAGMAAAALAASAEAAKPKFQTRQLPVNSTKLFELTAADIESDGDLDLFSTNHKYRGSLLLGNGKGGFQTLLNQSGLSATSHIPFFDDLYSEPRIATDPSTAPAGLHMWVDKDGNTYIRTKDLDGGAVSGSRVQGEIRFVGRGGSANRQLVSVKRASGAEVAMRRDASEQPSDTVVEFDAGPNALIKIRARFMDLPFVASIDPAFKRSRILLGPESVHPPSNEFRIDLGDRHGVAWADFDADGVLDAYIANGGVRGAGKRLGGIVADELYFGNGDGTFTEDLERTGAKTEKGWCRGRHAAPVDFDADGDLDIFVGCEERAPLLLMQRKPGKFGSQSQQLQSVKAKGEILRWTNLDRSDFPELVTVHDEKLYVYKRRAGLEKYFQSQKKKLPGYGDNGNTITLADVDRDGDPDAFVGSRGKNFLLINRNGKLQRVDPKRWGLPKRRTIAASFVDYDNNGALDFHAVPQGLHDRDGKRRFAATGKVRFGNRGDWASSQWLDYDSDGDRDLVSMLKRKSKRLKRDVYENRTRTGSWLAVDLIGPPGNREAIGARVTVGKGRSAQTGFVGESEGSRFSFGHYRLYYGLGSKRSMPVRVSWPDGTQTSLERTRTGRVLELRHPDAVPAYGG